MLQRGIQLVTRLDRIATRWTFAAAWERRTRSLLAENGAGRRDVPRLGIDLPPNRLRLSRQPSRSGASHRREERGAVRRATKRSTPLELRLALPQGPQCRAAAASWKPEVLQYRRIDGMQITKTRFPDRRHYSVRISRQLHDRLMHASSGMPENLYITTVLELAAAGATDLVRLGKFRDVGSTGEKVRVTVRLLPSLYERIQKLAKTNGVTMNRLIVFAISEAVES